MIYVRLYQCWLSQFGTRLVLAKDDQQQQLPYYYYYHYYNYKFKVQVQVQDLAKSNLDQ